jgi:hypothetical protein
MLSTRKYLAISMALSLLFHLLLYTVANKLPVFKASQVSKSPTPKKKPVKLSKVALDKGISKETTFKVNLKNDPAQISAALKQHLENSQHLAQINLPQVTPEETSKLSESLSIPPVQNNNELPVNFYHIDATVPELTGSTPSLSLSAPTSFGTPKLDIPASIGGLSDSPGLGDPNGTNSNNETVIGFKRPLPQITPPAINMAKSGLKPEGRDIGSPNKPISTQGESKNLPGEMDHFLSILPYVYIDAFDQVGYFRLDIQVNNEASGMEALDKDVFFILDSSRSISKSQLRQFTKGTIDSYSTLRPNDRFNSVIFTTDADACFPTLANTNPENIKKATDFLSFFRLFGARTDIYNSVKPFINDTTRENLRPIQLFLLTDGVSTVEESMENSAIISQITKNNNADISVFGFSCAKHTNSFLIDFLTYRNRGDSLILDDIENGALKLSNYIAQRSEIIVTDLKHRYHGNHPEDIFPKKLPHIYRNRTLSIYGTFNVTDKESTVQLIGRSSSGDRQLIYKIRFDEARKASPELAKNWASQKIFHLIGDLTDNPNTAIATEIANLQRKFKVYIPYTLPTIESEK